jgi:hypothetical protein
VSRDSERSSSPKSISNESDPEDVEMNDVDDTIDEITEEVNGGSGQAVVPDSRASSHSSDQPKSPVKIERATSTTKDSEMENGVAQLKVADDGTAVKEE